MVSPMLALPFAFSLLAARVSSLPIVRTQDPFAPFSCGQFVLKASVVPHEGTAESREQCFDLCKEKASEGCDHFKFTEGPEDSPKECVLYNSKAADGTTVLYKAFEEICTDKATLYKLGVQHNTQCPQKKLKGKEVSVHELVGSTRTRPLEMCRAKCLELNKKSNAQQKCSHYLLSQAPDDKRAKCRLFQEDPSGDDLLYFAGEASCTLPICGKYEIKAKNTIVATTVDRWRCADLTWPGGKTMFLFRETKKKDNCLIFDTEQESDLFVKLIPGETLCTSLLNPGVEPKFPAKGCNPQRTPLYGSILSENVSGASTVDGCKKACKGQCTHSLFNQFVDGTTRCDLFASSSFGKRLAHFANPSICSRKASSAGVVKKTCDTWEFYGNLIGTARTAANEASCGKACTGKCKAYVYDNRAGVPESERCSFYGTTPRSEKPLAYHNTGLADTKATNKLCFKQAMPSIQVPALPTDRLYGYLIDFSSVGTTQDCIDLCNKIDFCTHAIPNSLTNECRLFQEKEEEKDNYKNELAFIPGDSVHKKDAITTEGDEFIDPSIKEEDNPNGM